MSTSRPMPPSQSQWTLSRPSGAAAPSAAILAGLPRQFLAILLSVLYIFRAVPSGRSRRFPAPALPRAGKMPRIIVSNHRYALKQRKPRERYTRLRGGGVPC
ncbi:hypothetical protein VTH82DRAFT_86 [Thermothelomyces myriococcoides]